MTVTLHNHQPSLDQLRDVGLFGALDDEALLQFAAQLEIRLFEPGQLVFEEGQPGRDMFVVLEGELEVSKKSQRGRQARLALLGPGDWFGEMALVDVMPRSATIRSLAPTRLLRLHANDLDTLYRSNLKAYSLLVMNIAREMSRRLRVADAILADAVTSLYDRYSATKAANNAAGGGPGAATGDVGQ